MKVVFLSGIFTEALLDNIQSDSIGPIQNAADVLQKHYIEGFAKNKNVSFLSVINIPFIGGYPGLYKFMNYRPTCVNDSYSGVPVKNVGFFNLKGIKNISRLWVALKEINKVECTDKVNIVCYSMHLPFLLACYISAAFNSKINYYVIVPDLPEFMVDRRGVSRILYACINKISYFIVNKSNGVSVITEQMKSKFHPKLNSVIIEGIASLSRPEQCSIEKNEKYMLYSGTLDRRYGIKDLVNAFIESGVTNLKLVICGDGNERNFVIEKSQQFENIVYEGQVERSRAIALQKKAFLLVNPRSNDSAFTKYSFPSKIIEYMSSGVPVLMYKLDGIPDDFNGYFYEIKNKNDFSGMIRYVSNLSDNELKEMGDKAKKFIIDEKSSVKQTDKLISIMLGK